MRRLESKGELLGDTYRGFTVVEPDEGRSEENFQIRAALGRWARPRLLCKIDAAGIEWLETLRRDDEGRSPMMTRSYADLNRVVLFRAVSVRAQPAANVHAAASLGVTARRSAGSGARMLSRCASTRKSRMCCAPRMPPRWLTR